MNYDLNNLYGSSGAISSRLGAAAEMSLFKNSCQIYSKMGHYGLLRRRIRRAAGKPPLHIEKSAPVPPKRPRHHLRRKPFGCVGVGPWGRGMGAAGDALSTSKYILPHIFYWLAAWAPAYVLPTLPLV
jgi:hypothetical protein